MWWRAAVGVVAVAVGVVWIGQGVGAVHGSFMTGHGEYTALGIVVALAGITMLGWAARTARRSAGRAGP